MAHPAPAHVVVAGGMLVDVRGATAHAWVPGRSIPGTIRLVPGGAGRNVAVHLARMGYRVTLLSAVGDDPLGDWLLGVTAESGVDVGHVVRGPSQTGMFVAIGPEGGEPWCIADAAPQERVTVEEIHRWRSLLADAAVVVGDANMLEPAQGALAEVAGPIPRVLLGTSPDKAARLRAVLAGAAGLVCNRDEARALTGLPPTLSWQALGVALLTEGVQRVVVTQGPAGIGVVTTDGEASAPALPVPIVDATGAGDAVAAVVVHACVAGLDPARTAALAAAAAAIVVQSAETTPAGVAAVLDLP